MSDAGKLVYIVDDDPSFRKSLDRLLRVSGFETATFENADAFLAQAGIRRPACLLLDVRLPGLNGIRLQEKLLEQDIRLPIVFVTGHGNIPMSVRAMKAGAVDFLTKPFSETQLLNAVDAALERDLRATAMESEKEKIRDLLDTLTPRETEILRWVISGHLNKQIAYILGISEKTVKIHRGRVMEKLKATSVAQLVRLAEQAGISPVQQTAV
jgi:FixJ family two-component response regulator